MKFEVKARVKLTRAAEKMFPTYRDEQGDVLRRDRNGNLRIKFDRHKTVYAWSPSMVSKIRVLWPRTPA